MRNRAREVIDVLSEFGWTKGDYVDDEGGFCMLGAIAFNEIGAADYSDISTFYVVGASPARKAINPTIEILNRIISAEYPERHGDNGSVDIFNDHCETSFADVIRVLEKAAAMIDEVVE